MEQFFQDKSNEIGARPRREIVVQSEQERHVIEAMRRMTDVQRNYAVSFILKYAPVEALQIARHTTMLRIVKGGG